MFNRQSVFFQGGDTNTNIKVNAVTGGIVKNHANSYFKRFHLKSEYAEKALSQSPHRTYKDGYITRRVDIEVLQLVVVGDMEVIAEVIDIIPEKDEKGVDEV